MGGTITILSKSICYNGKKKSLVPKSVCESTESQLPYLGVSNYNSIFVVKFSTAISHHFKILKTNYSTVLLTKQILQINNNHAIEQQYHLVQIKQDQSQHGSTIRL